jgi:catechol 2,3-dioxygenase-like lactoylglutathione lyase family enzyme
VAGIPAQMRTGPEPILPARDLRRTRAFYESLGFSTGYDDDNYTILSRGELVIHLERNDELVPEHNQTSCYWRVRDADQLHGEFAVVGLPAAGIPRLTRPGDRPWGMREFALVDPSGNLVRIGHELHQS